MYWRLRRLARWRGAVIVQYAAKIHLEPIPGAGLALRLAPLLLSFHATKLSSQINSRSSSCRPSNQAFTVPHNVLRMQKPPYRNVRGNVLVFGCFGSCGKRRHIVVSSSRSASKKQTDRRGTARSHALRARSGNAKTERKGIRRGLRTRDDSSTRLLDTRQRYRHAGDVGDGRAKKADVCARKVSSCQGGFPGSRMCLGPGAPNHCLTRDLHSASGKMLSRVCEVFIQVQSFVASLIKRQDVQDS